MFEGGWDEVQTSLLPGHCCYKEPLTHHPDGSVKTFRGYKVEKSQGDEEDNWAAITLCNRESYISSAHANANINSLWVVAAQTEMSSTSGKVAEEGSKGKRQTEAWRESAKDCQKIPRWFEYQERCPDAS
jgi:hypothetical protein